MLDKKVFPFQVSWILLMMGLIFSFNYIERIQHTLERTSGKLNYHIGFIATHFYEYGQKQTFLNWGFFIFVILGIILLYYSIFFKDGATGFGVNENNSDQKE